MRKSTIWALLFLLFIVLPPLTVLGESPEPISLFVKGNESYQKGDYASALAQYKKILEDGIRNGQVYYNLGNTYFRMGQIGRAIQHYLLAGEFTPRNEDLEANLRYAREETEDQIRPSGSVLREVFFWSDRLTIKEMTYGFLICNFFFFAALTLRLFIRHPFLNWALASFLLIGLTLGGTAMTQWVQTRLHTPAVVVVPKASVQSGMDPKSITLFVLHEGAEVAVDQTRRDWCLIRLPSGKRGWVKREQIGLVEL
jgi:hypothetical protein